MKKKNSSIIKFFWAKKGILKRLKADCILYGRSFESIVKSHFQDIVKISSETLKNECTRIADLIKCNVFNLLKSSEFGFLSFDEWSDKRPRRFLGFISVFLFEDKMHTSFLGLKDIDTIVAEPSAIATIIVKVP